MISFLLIPIFLLSITAVALADGDLSSDMPSGYVAVDLWNWINHNAYDNADTVANALDINGFEIPIQSLTKLVDANNICEGDGNSDSYHHALYKSEVEEVSGDPGQYKCTCHYCGEEYLVRMGDRAKEEYQNMVDELPSDKISSDGGYYIQSYIINKYTTSTSPESFIASSSYTNSARSYYIYTSEKTPSLQYIGFWLGVQASEPGTFYVEAGPADLTAIGVTSAGVSVFPSQTLSYHASSGYVASNTQYRFYTYRGSGSSYYVQFPVGSGGYASITYYAPRVRFVPAVPSNVVSGDTYNINNRVWNYSPIINVGGTTNNTKIVNETNNTFYNPTTNNYYMINNWNYDYSTTTYNMVVQDDSDEDVTHQVVVQYGDQSVTVTMDGTSSTYVYITLDIGSGGEGGETVDVDLTETNNLLTDIKNFCEDIWETCTGVDDKLQDVIDIINDWDFTGSGSSPDPVNPDVPDYSTPLGRIIELLNTISEKLGNDNDEIIYVGSDGEDKTLDLDNLNADILGKFDWIWSFRSLMHVFVQDAVGGSFEISDVNVQVPSDDTAPDDDEEDSGLYLTDSAFVSAEPSAPVVEVDFSASSGLIGSSFSDSVPVIDLSWYAPYKDGVDSLISGILWAFFLWSVFKRIPSILGMQSVETDNSVSKAEKFELPKAWSNDNSHMHWGGFD